MNKKNKILSWVEFIVGWSAIIINIICAVLLNINTICPPFSTAYSIVFIIWGVSIIAESSILFFELFSKYGIVRIAKQKNKKEGK